MSLWLFAVRKITADDPVYAESYLIECSSPCVSTYDNRKRDKERGEHGREVRAFGRMHVSFVLKYKG